MRVGVKVDGCVSERERERGNSRERQEEARWGGGAGGGKGGVDQPKKENDYMTEAYCSPLSRYK